MVKRIRAWRWLRQAHVPVVPGLRLRQGGCRYARMEGKTSCYLGGLKIGWEGPLKTLWDKRDLYHEAGHAFLRCWTTSGDREHIKHLVTWWPQDRPWFWSDRMFQEPMPLEEKFADLYADLAMTTVGYPALRALLQSIADRNAPNYQAGEEDDH